METLNYTPNALARSMIHKKTFTIGLMIPDIADSFFSGNASGVEEAMAKSGHSVVYVSTSRDPEKEKRFLSSAVERRWDGLIVTPDNMDERFIDMLQKLEIPVVFLRRKPPKELKFPFVDANHYDGAAQLTEHLIGLGHRNIGFIQLPSQIGAERFEGYLDTMRKHGLLPLPSLIAKGGRTFADGRRAMESLYAANLGLTAVFAGNDLLGIGALEWLAIHEIPVPDRISVVGFDNRDYSNLHWIQLTTMEQPIIEMGRKAAELLLQMISNKEKYADSVLMETRMITRKTTKSVSEV